MEQRFPWRRGWPALLAAACLAVPAAAQAPPSSTTAPDSGFDEVEADLEGQLFTKTLPFDVPFIIYGKVPAGAQTLEIRCWNLGGGRKSGEPVIDAAKLQATAPEGNCWQGGHLVWQNTIDPAEKNPQFRVLAPRLEAEQYYTFKFSYEKQVTDDEANAFAAKVKEVVSRVLWGDPGIQPQLSFEDLPLSGPLSTQELIAICRDLRAALKEVTKADRIVKAGTMFSEGRDCSEVVEEVNVRLRGMRELQLKISQAIPNYVNRVANITSLLARVRNDPALLKLQQALESQGTANPSLLTHAKTISDVLALADLPALNAQDRKDASTLTAFVTAGVPVATAARGKLAALDDLLGKKLFNADGSPVDFLRGLADASALTAADVEALRRLADPLSDPRRAFRAVDGALSVLQGLQEQLTQRAATLELITNQYRTEVVGVVILAGSTTGSFATQHKNYVSADTGLAYTPELDEFPTYVGTNIYFRPVNKAAALSQFGPFFSKASLGRRVSVTIGLTAQGVGDDGKTRKDLFNSQSLILGIGARMTNSVRLTLGGLVFLKTDPNPLVNDDTVAVTPFLSLSFDIDVAPTLQGIGGLFKTGS